MAKKIVTVFGYVFLLIGVLGFVPGITSDGLLLGIFEVDALHNIVHLVSGILAIIFAKKGEQSAKTYAKVFGLVYALVAVLGFVTPDLLNSIMHVNGADNALHTLLAVIFLVVGFGGSKNV